MNLKNFALSHQGYYRNQNEDAYLEQAESGVFMVADGIGSLSKGEWASQILAQPFDNLNAQQSLIDRVYTFKRELVKRHQYLFYRQEELACGATIVALLMDEQRAAILWAGDARAYCYYKNSKKLIQVTKDHVYQRAVTRAAGVEKDLMLDEKFINLQGDEIFLLCSDGLNKGISQNELIFFLAQNLSLSATCKKLIDFSLQRGSTDNITVLLVSLC